MPISPRAFLSALALSGLCTGVHAAEVVIPFPPQCCDGVQTQIAVQHPFGQSFTATASRIDTIWLRLSNMNMSFEWAQDRFVTLRLYAGEGFEGQLLRSSTVDVDAILGQTLNSEAVIGFDFGTHPVAMGQQYSFQVLATSPRYGTYWVGNDQYKGGRAILQGSFFDDPDVYFSVTSAVPAPPSALFMLAGLAGVLTWVRRPSAPRSTK